ASHRNPARRVAARRRRPHRTAARAPRGRCPAIAHPDPRRPQRGPAQRGPSTRQGPPAQALPRPLPGPEITRRRTRHTMKPELLDALEIETAPQPTHAVIWLHGLGADGHDFAPIVPELRLDRAPAVRFVFPHAPVQPVTINGGMAM